MSDTAADQLRRVLLLIPKLADDENHDIDEVAALLGVDRATLLRDVRSLADRFDDPGGFVAGVTIMQDHEMVSVHASHFLRPMRLTVSELAALDLGLAMLRGLRPQEELAVVDGARARLREVLAELPDSAEPPPLRAASLGALTPELRATREVLRHATRDRHKVRIGYRKADAAEAGERVICPYGLIFSRGTWYLVAHCESSAGLRVFRLDRIMKVEQLDESFDGPEEEVLASVVRDGHVFHTEDPVASVTIRYSPAVAGWIAEREGVPLDEDGSLTRDYPLADTDWAVRHVL
ncbi:MAG TPA: WYL domain-containing protein, partial [Gemmatimonadales bacterium]|nr:WYL domain-containing protein [Gemmatimonadales bacterium]